MTANKVVTFAEGDTAKKVTGETLAIDSHAHVYPEKYLDLLEHAGRDPQTTKIARGMGADSSDEDMTERLNWMDRVGVEIQVLAVTPQVPANMDSAEWINDEYARLIARYPGRFAAYGALPLPNIDAALEELPRVYDRGFLGISVPTVFYDGTTLDCDEFDPLWSALDERKEVVNIHPTGYGACSPLIAGKGLE